MATVDVYIRDTIWTYMIPIGFLTILLFLFVTDSFKVIRQWYCSKYLTNFSELHDEIIEPVKKALFADLNNIDSSLTDLRNKGLIRILEIGIGSGSNLKYYPQQCRLVIVDPSPHFKQYFTENINKFPDINLERYIVSPAERIRGIASSTVDVVVTTTVLCCVENVPKVLKEIRRVLVPGGHYYFLEHVVAPHNTKRWKLQQLANWSGLWKWLHDGCVFRRLDEDIAKAGFSDLDISTFTLDDEAQSSKSKLIQMISPHIVGVAIK
ncbi:Methyltransferase-like protein 7A [Orchesella cincta]|uniref:Methyltransferase-like protein 7A n=1 Tax=Orchesella cincta TaxID=48709 RepID=A0A1D2MFT5_ORCCI|nr:Methyltransferase-like protein 7A [Orchesella cincta]